MGASEAAIQKRRCWYQPDEMEIGKIHIEAGLGVGGKPQSAHICPVSRIRGHEGGSHPHRKTRAVQRVAPFARFAQKKRRSGGRPKRSSMQRNFGYQRQAAAIRQCGKTDPADEGRGCGRVSEGEHPGSGAVPQSLGNLSGRIVGGKNVVRARGQKGSFPTGIGWCALHGSARPVIANHLWFALMRRF